MEDQQLTEQQSLKIITGMIQKARANVHTNGISAILWGTVVGIACLLSFAGIQWHFDIHFDIWLIVLAADGNELMLRNVHTGALQHVRPWVLSQSSLLLLLYAIPALVTGITVKFRPMIIGAILCYVFFVISCFTPLGYDYLLNGMAGIACWLIPGIILYRRCSKATGVNV